MKRRNIAIKTLTGAMLSAALLASSCQNLLEEEPRSSVTTDLFKTAEGVNLALTGVYSTLRNLYGPLGIYMQQEMGTDEVVMGQNQFQNLHEVIVNPSNHANDWWSGLTFGAINACNGIIDKGTEFGVDARLLGEARVFRALYYFNLVQTSGPAPLDLGSGKLVFNEAYVNTSVRDAVEDVYAAIFADLEQAITDLAGTARDDRARGVVTKTFAQYVYAKANLTYGWWLQNNGKGNQAAYFQKAYDTALTAINDTGSGFGLMPTYYDVNLAQNDRNKEWIFYADRDYNLPYVQNSVTSGGFASSGAPENSAFLAIRMNFDQAVVTGGATPFYRGNTQDSGRPWYRAAPSYEVTNTIFNDKEHDSRYYGTFQEAWVYKGYPNGSGSLASVNGGPDYIVGDTVWYIPAITPAGIGEAGEKSTQPGGPALPYQTLPGKKYAIWDLQHYTSYHYPSLWKLGPYRPDLANPRQDENAASLRPFAIAKFSEFYLLAAEAAVKGATGSMSATQLLNVLRTRAAKRTGFKSDAEAAASAAYLTSQTPAAPTIDYILDERMRELYGEGLRWYDLIRTKTWGKRAAKYTIRKWDGWQGSALPPAELFTRTNIENLADDSYLYLRPIPQTSIDALNMDIEGKRAYQNPGYK